LEVLLPSLEKRSLSVRLAGPLCGAMMIVVVGDGDFESGKALENNVVVSVDSGQR
jgi:hypothetical protein